MHILILGGTAFVGRTAALEAVARGHRVTLLNRGNRNPPAGVDVLTGDRMDPNGGLAVLEGRSFDAVIDTWAGSPVAVTRAVEALRGGRAGHYTYISSIAAYNRKVLQPGILYSEDSLLYDGPDPGHDHEESYQYDKRRGEIEAERADVPILIVRPGVILGPYESSYIQKGRLTWWLDRLCRGGPTLAPEPRELPLQLVDVRDMIRFVLDGIENKLSGAFNLLDEPGSVTTQSLLEIGRKVTGSHAELVWKAPDDILNAGIKNWTEMPLWHLPNTPGHTALYSWDTSKARRFGFICRPFEETVQDTWNWMQAGDERPVPLPADSKRSRLGYSPEQEAKVLGASTGAVL
ncbi:putative NAD-dependent epimerase/dehydratase [Xylariales sp. PMI_506]|nr:putative NAD-dependent epimerase/dehydratase [Xylariales sp. PMI_506]